MIVFNFQAFRWLAERTGQGRKIVCRPWPVLIFRDYRWGHGGCLNCVMETSWSNGMKLVGYIDWCDVNATLDNFDAH